MFLIIINVVMQEMQLIKNLASKKKVTLIFKYQSRSIKAIRYQIKDLINVAQEGFSRVSYE